MANRIEDRSPLWNWAAGAAVVAGTGATLINSWNKVGNAYNVDAGRTIKSVASRLRGAQPFAQSTNVASVSPDINTLTEHMLNKHFSKDTSSLRDVLFETGYRSSMATGKISHDEAIAALSPLFKSPKGSGPVDAYRQTVGALGSLGARGDIFENQMGPLLKGGMSDPFRATRGKMKAWEPSSAIFPADFSRTRYPIAKDIEEQFARSAGDRFKINWKYRYAESTIGGKAQRAPMMIGEIYGSGSKARAASNLYIPLTDNPRFTFTGEYLQSEYALRNFYNQAGEKLNYRNVYVSKMNELLAGASVADIDQLMEEQARLFHHVDLSDKAIGQGGLWRRPESMRTAGELARTRLAQFEAAPLGRYSEEAIEGLINSPGAATKWFPYVSPGPAGAGVLTEVNLPEAIHGNVGRFISAEETPGQFIRGDWAASRESKLAAGEFRGSFGAHFSRLEDKIQGPRYRELLFGGATSPTAAEAYTSPKLWTAYALADKGDDEWLQAMIEGRTPGAAGKDFRFKSDPLNKYMAAEEGIIAPSASRLLEGERITSKRIALDPGFKIHEEISRLQGTTVGGQPVLFNVGSGTLGVERGTGRALELGIGETLRTEAIGGRLVDSDTAEIYLRERVRVGPKESIKVFGWDLKNVISASGSETEFTTRAREAGVSLNAFGQKTELIAGAGILEKRTSAMFLQQTEGLAAAFGRRLDSLTPRRERAGIRRLSQINELEGFLRDPGQLLQGDDPYAIQKRLIERATKDSRIRLSNKELAGVFGAAKKEDLLRLVREGVITGEQAVAIKKSKFVYGASRSHFGDLIREGGALRRGSVEQALFVGLGGQGEIGRDILTDMTKRIRKTDSQLELNKMLESVTESAILGKSKAEALGQIKYEDLLTEEGRYLDFGRKFKSFGGSQYMYLPGLNNVPGLGSSISEKGDRITGPIMKQLGLMQRLIEEKAPEEQLEKAAHGLRNAVARHTEANAAARGELIGSKVLAATQRTAKGDHLRLNPKTVESMFQDAIDTALDQKSKEFLMADKARILAGQGEVGVGYLHRFPAQWPFSTKAVRYVVDPEVAEEAAAFARREGSLILNNKPARSIDISDMIGSKTDTDNDKNIMSIVSDRDTATRAAKSLQHGISEDEARWVIMNSELKENIHSLRAKDVVDFQTARQTQISGLKKLRTVQSATPIINTAMAKTKMGLLTNAPDQYRDIASFLAQFEEITIGSKKGGIAGSQLAKQYSEFLEQKNYQKMEELLGSVFGPARKIEGSLEVSDATFKHAYGYDPAEMSRQVIDPYHASKADIDTAVKARGFAKGKSYIDPSLDEVRKMMNLRARGTADIGTAAVEELATGGGLYKEAASETQRMATKARNAGKAFWNNKWPLVAGLTAAAGIMLMAPSGAGRVPAVRPPSRSGRGEEDAYMPGGPGIRPPDPRMTVAPSVYDFSLQPHSTNANLYMSADDLARNQRNFNNQMQGLGASGRGRITIRDDRSSLDAHQLAGRISERL